MHDDLLSDTVDVAFSTISSLTILGPCIDLALKEVFPEHYTEQIMPRR